MAPVLLKGVSRPETVSIAELSAAARAVPRIDPQIAPVDLPLRHRLPDGHLTSTPSPAMLAALPPTAIFNADVVDGTPGTHFTGFTGLHAADNLFADHSEIEPPDQGLAVHDGVVAEIINNALRFFDAVTGKPLSPPIAAADFFRVDTRIYGLSDPQVFFDNGSGRWFFTEIFFNYPVDYFAVAVSRTADPLGDYAVYHVEAASSTIPGCRHADCLPDYPKAGIDAHALFITADLFEGSGVHSDAAPDLGGQFVGSAIFALPKRELERGAPVSAIRFDDVDDFVVQPSVPAPEEPYADERDGTEFFMSAPGAGTLAVLAIDHTRDIVERPQRLRLLRTTVPSQTYGAGTVPSTQPPVIGPYCRSIGATSAPSLDGGYSAFGASIQKANGELYGALAYGAFDALGLERNVIGWFAVRPRLSDDGLSASVVRQGRIIPPAGYSLSYPAFGLRRSAEGAVGFTITNPRADLPGGFPSAAYIRFEDHAQHGDIVVSGPGAATDDGYTGCEFPGPAFVGRWGDYGAATVDAATGEIYTASEMIPDPKRFKPGRFSNFGTYITRIHVRPE